MIDQKLEQEVHLLHKRVCYALADPNRVLLLYALSEGPLCVSELVEALDVSQPTVSRHLRVLRDRGLVNPERKGTAIYYNLTDRRLIEALDLLRGVLSAQMAANADLVQSLS
ncbi:MAG: metalloregulator ArsR/SmtB family transcription factor [Chloroflexota bacterium]|nr:metalloregulator ArsR/SmtB family transcription factor [Chloroflexota bacterium]